MSANDYDACETRVLAHEGGYTNDPQDPGGPTNWGITIADARAYWKKDATAADVKAMPVSVAKTIYRAKYWNALRCDDLPPGVDDSVFDYGVNSGIGRAGKVLRRVLDQPDDDWHVTDAVLKAAAVRDPKAIVTAINDERLRFLQSLSTWPHFGKGWGARVAEVKTFSLQLASGSTTPPVVKAPVPGKGHVPKPSAGPVVAGGAAAASASGGIIHWLGAHPILIVGLALAGAALLIFLVGRLRQSQQAAKVAQEAPTPGLVPAPIKS